MKKFICILLILFSFICLLSSCSKTDTEAKKNNLYYFNLEQGVLKKTNLHTEKISFVCDDPICEHGYDCKFSNAHTPTLVGTTLYFYREADMFVENEIPYMKTQICGYDYVSGEYIVFEEITHSNKENVCGKFQIYDGYIYYYQQIVIDDQIEFTMRRINIETKEKETFDWHHNIWHFAIEDGRLYFSDSVDGIYSTDIYFKDRQYILKPRENTLIYARRIDSEGNIYYVESQGVGATKTDVLMKYDVLENTSYVIDSSHSIIYVHVIDGSVYYIKGYSDGANYVTYEPSLYVWLDNKIEVLYTANKNLKSLNSCGTYLIVEQSDEKITIINTTA